VESEASKEIAAITGHTTLKEIERYTKAAEQRKLAMAAIARLAPRPLSKTGLKVWEQRTTGLCGA